MDNIRVKESVFSIEGKLSDMKEFEHHAMPGMSLASLAIIEATRFWVREDAVNEELSQIDLSVLRSVAQLGGTSYGRVTETFELPRSAWKDAVKEEPRPADISGAGKNDR
jgi:hypothetical protein